MSPSWQNELWVTWTDAWTGVVAGAGIYLAVVLLSRVFTQRAIASVASFDFPVTVAIGAVVGRTALVHTSLAGGIIALVTLFSLQALLGFARNRLGLEHVTGSPPRILVVEGRFLEDQLRKGHLSRSDVYEKIRISGVGRLADVRLMILERGGAVSVITGSAALDETLLSDAVHDPELRRRLSRPWDR